MDKKSDGIKDAWDLGILIRMNKWKSLPLERINFELVSEVGWLEGGEEELKERLERLEKQGYLKENKAHRDVLLQKWYDITEKGEKILEGEK